MAFTKHASFEVSDILDIKGTPTRQHTASLDKVADYENYRTNDGYMYVRLRAISSRVNKNHDGWPTVELAGKPEILSHHHSGSGFTVEASEGNHKFGFATFVGKPIFVDHNNSDPKKARGVIVDAKFRVLDPKEAKLDNYWSSHEADPEHLPASEVELLLEIDAHTFPKLAKNILNGDLDGFSMGADVERSKCSHCGHIATNPDEYCSHVLMKGAHHDFKTADGKRVSKKSYENCYGIKFFEISAVFDPADETAIAREVRSHRHEADIFPDVGMRHDPLRDDPAVADQAMDAQGLPLPIDNNGMPGRGGLEGFPPPVRLNEPHPVGVEFGNSAKDALDEQWPQRPLQNDPRWSSTKTAEAPLPQSMLVHAPDEVDTLRDESLCPICGSEMEGETCDVCGYTEPPKPFQNPDLSEAQKIRQQMKEVEEQQAQPEAAAPQSGPAAQANGIIPATKARPTASVTNDMRWTPLVTAKQAARINNIERPVGASNTPTTNEPKNETIIKDQTKPVTSAMLTAQRLMANAQRNHTGEFMSTQHTADGPTPPGDTSAKERVDTTGVGGVDEASNPAASKADAQVDVTGIGGTGVEGVAADETDSLPTAGEKSDDAGFNTDKQIESIPTKTYGDKDGEHSGVGQPVTRKPFPASADGVKASTQRQGYDDKTLEQNEQQGNDPVAKERSAVQGVQPADPVATDSYKRENLLEHKTSPANNSGETKTWSGTEGNGVLRQQDPVTRELPASGGVTYPDVQLHTNSKAHLIAAVRLAETEQELGLTDRESKWERVAELEAQTPEQVQAQLETLSRVKTAGLAKLAQHRQARRVPSAFGKQTAAPNGFERIASDHKPIQKEAAASDELMDAALFTR